MCYYIKVIVITSIYIGTTKAGELLEHATANTLLIIRNAVAAKNEE